MPLRSYLCLVFFLALSLFFGILPGHASSKDISMHHREWYRYNEKTCTTCLDVYRLGRGYEWSISGVLGFSRIDSIEESDQSRAAISSKLNQGLEFGLSRDQVSFHDSLKLEILEQELHPDDNRLFVSNKVRTHHLSLTRSWHYWDHFTLITGIGSQEFAYLSTGSDSTQLILNPVSQNYIKLGYRLMTKSEALYQEFWGQYFLSSSAAGFRVWHGTGFGFAVGWHSQTDLHPAISLWFNYQDLKSSITSQKQQSLGIKFGILIDS